MLKLIHIIFIFTSLFSFISRVILSEFKPEILQQKWLKITPHIIDTILLLSGIMLVIQGQWLSGEFAWLLAKITALFGYIGFSVVVMRSQGKKRWLAFVGSLCCFAYILIVAISKNPLFFL